MHSKKSAMMINFLIVHSRFFGWASCLQAGWAHLNHYLPVKNAGRHLPVFSICQARSLTEIKRKAQKRYAFTTAGKPDH
jgi:hypothetical protein